MLLPRFWTPWVRARGRREPLRPRHRRLGRALPPRCGPRAPRTGRSPSASTRSGFYLYDRFRPTFLVSAQDTTDVYTDGRLRHAAGRACRPRCPCAAPCAPSRRSRPPGGASARRCWAATGPRTASTSAASRRPGRSPRPKSYPYSISPVDGGRLRLAWLHEAKALGSDLSLDKLTADAPALPARLRRARRPRPARGGRHDLRARRSSSGRSRWAAIPDGSLFDIVRTNHAVLRGYPDNAFTGRRYAAFNAEYRFPLFSPAAGLALVPALPAALPRVASSSTRRTPGRASSGPGT